MDCPKAGVADDPNNGAVVCAGLPKIVCGVDPNPDEPDPKELFEPTNN